MCVFAILLVFFRLWSIHLPLRLPSPRIGEEAFPVLTGLSPKLIIQDDTSGLWYRAAKGPLWSGALFPRLVPRPVFPCLTCSCALNTHSRRFQQTFPDGLK